MVLACGVRDGDSQSGILSDAKAGGRYSPEGRQIEPTCSEVRLFEDWPLTGNSWIARGLIG
jgi:hypothetical protein